MKGSTLTTSEPRIRLPDNQSTEGVGEGDEVEYGSLYLRFHVTYMLWVTVPPVLLAVGWFGNVMTVVVMRAMRTSESTACLSVYFTALAVSDLCLLTTSVLWDWPVMAFNTKIPYLRDLPCTVPFFFSYTSSMTSAWFLVAMTCQRLMSVVLPHRVAVLCTVKRGVIITASIVTLVCFLNVYIFFIYHLQNVDGEYEECVSVDEGIAYLFRLLDLFLASVIPFLFLIMTNAVLIHRAMQSVQISRELTWNKAQQTASRSSKVSSMTRTLILTSLAFLLLTLPTCILDMYLEAVGFYKNEIEDERVSEMLTVAETICVMLWISNSAINFYIYVLSGSKFRLETKRCFCVCFKAMTKPLKEMSSGEW
ncbi:uncharacterized protein LOC143297073 [Babylonia areolata]|uniref:uncharacterized protein LOC143297073 n=1 Tax=Babylonia areolata TaxID=304850 RepID=UPI003FD48E35